MEPGSVVVTVGDELLAGRTVDTNGAWLSMQLRGLGFVVRHRETVGDDAGAVAASLGRARELGGLVVLTGGLGPTADDLTREGVARGLGLPLEPHAGARELMAAFFAARGGRVPDRDLHQADLPRGAEPLRNSRGTAPGFLLRQPDVWVLVLPGVPEEMRLMFDREVRPLLEAHPGRGPAPRQRVLTVVGLPEAELGELLRDLLQRDRPTRIGSYPQVASIELVLEVGAGDPEQAEDLLEADVAEIRRRLGDRVLGEGRLTLPEMVGRRLMESGSTLAVAESLTGGRLSDALVGVPGISAVFLAGLVTYADAVKRDVLGVREETLAAHGAVSEACAREMAVGVRRVAGAGIGVSTTGIAGPSGGSADKPVGTVWMGVATGSGVRAERRVLVGDRGQIRDRTVHWALMEILPLLR